MRHDVRAKISGRRAVQRCAPARAAKGERRTSPHSFQYPYYARYGDRDSATSLLNSLEMCCTVCNAQRAAGGVDMDKTRATHMKKAARRLSLMLPGAKMTGKRDGSPPSVQAPKLDT